MVHFQGFHGSSIVPMGRGKTKVLIPKRSAPSVKTVNEKVKRIKRAMETKWTDAQLGPVDIDGANGTLLLLNGAGRGSSQQQRTGNMTRATSIYFICDIFGQTDNVAKQSARLIIFWDKQANGVAPVVSGNGDSQGLLDSTAVVAGIVYAPPNMNNKERYKILYDKIVTLQGHPGNFTPATGALTTVIPQSRILRKKIKLNRLVGYGGAGDLIADIDTNSLYALLLTDISSVANPPNAYLSTRFNYKDN